MSLTTIAAPIQPDEKLASLPASKPERFQRSDFIAAGLVFLITLGVYIATLAPSVTLEDSGELITGAVHFGVPHPPGYPLWTMAGFIFSHLFPFGNMAWRINLESALFGATANAVLTLLVCHSGRWLLQRWTDPPLQPIVRQFAFYAGIMTGLTIGFSDVMWSEAVIAEVYTLNALFVNLVLLFFYLWMLEPRKNHRLIIAVLIFSLGLTNHHTLVQIIPAFLLAAWLVRAGKFWSVFIAVNLFSLSILVYISWLSGDADLQTISEKMAWLIFLMTAAVSFFYLKTFRLHLFLLGAATAVMIFAYGYYFLTPSETDTARYLPSNSHFWQWGSLVNGGWLQNTSSYAVLMLGAAALALGLLYTSLIDRRLVIGVFVAGWIGLMPYSYEHFASSTNPPMNWGFASERSGFYYAVSREQYPKSLPVLIKTTFGKVLGVIDKNTQLDSTIGLPNYFGRLALSMYFYGYTLQDNVTVPLIFVTLSVLIFLRRCDRPQINWFIFLGAAFFFLGFMLQVIAPPESFDFQRNLAYKVFYLQSHCIFALFIGYGVLAAMTYLHESWPEVAEKNGALIYGIPTLFLTLLPLMSNFDDCNQAGHWFGYNYGADIMRPLDKDAVYYGGSDPGRFVPTYMAFVESQQPERWKREPGFDRRDVAVITQNALCDTFYSQYIRYQYDNRYRPKPDQYTSFEKWLGRDQAYPKTSTLCLTQSELLDCWTEFRSQPDVVARVKRGEPEIRPGSNDIFEINGLVAKKIFNQNKRKHTFYVEQSIPIEWMYPYLLPSGLIFKLNPTPMTDEEFKSQTSLIEEDRKFWTDYSQRLLQDPKFHVDDDAKLYFGKLALWHSDLYRWRQMDKEEEYWLKISIALCPQEPDGINNLTRLLARLHRIDEALAVSKQAELDDPYSEQFKSLTQWLEASKMFARREDEVKAKLATAPYDLKLNLDLARLLQDEGKFDELKDRLRIAAGLTNWTHEDMAAVVQYYVDKVNNPEAAIAFLETRAQIDPTQSELVYNLAALQATLDHKDSAIKYLTLASQYGGTNALVSAEIDPRFVNLHEDSRFQAMLDTLPSPRPALVTNVPASDTNSPATNAPTTAKPAPILTTTNQAATNAPVPSAPKKKKS